MLAIEELKKCKITMHVSDPAVVTTNYQHDSSPYRKQLLEDTISFRMKPTCNHTPYAFISVGAVTVGHICAEAGN